MNFNKTIKSLLKEQQKDGSFLSWTSKNPKNFKGVKIYHSVFSSALILSCLASADQQELGGLNLIQEKLFNFLLSQKSDNWSFNYWKRDSKEFKTMSYPDDLDDTFCALAAICAKYPKIIDGKALAKIVSLLTAMEKEEGGPYRTWLVAENSDEKWKDVDLAVNNNVAYFLSLQEIFLPKIKKFIESAIVKNEYVSPYYPSEYPIIYFISRWYNGKEKQKIIDFLFSKQDKNGKWDNPLNTALAVSGLLNFGVQPKKISRAIDYILNSRQKNGLWKAFAFCVELIIKGEKYYSGSSALTTAFCLEAINKYKKISNYSNYSKQIQNSKLEKENKIYTAVLKEYQRRFSGFSKDFQNNALTIRDKILKKNKSKDIILLPYFFRSALGDNGKSISDDFIVQLGLANLFGWTAYTIYDDFFDKEDGIKPEMLSLANVCLRESYEIFIYQFAKSINRNKLFKNIFDGIDAANYQESQYPSRFPRGSASILRNSALWQKSMGHALGPIAILFKLGYGENSPEVKNLMEFFKHYIIARQLNDDAHDWEEDLKKRVLTPAVALLLKNAGQTRDFNEQTKQKFQEIFWKKIIVLLCRDILKATKLARKALNKIGVIKDKKIFNNLIQIAEDSAKTALKERKETMKFLKTYNLR